MQRGVHKVTTTDKQRGVVRNMEIVALQSSWNDGHEVDVHREKVYIRRRPWDLEYRDRQIYYSYSAFITIELLQRYEQLVNTTPPWQ